MGTVPGGSPGTKAWLVFQQIGADQLGSEKVEAAEGDAGSIGGWVLVDIIPPYFFKAFYTW